MPPPSRRFLNRLCKKDIFYFSDLPTLGMYGLRFKIRNLCQVVFQHSTSAHAYWEYLGKGQTVSLDAIVLIVFCNSGLTTKILINLCDMVFYVLLFFNFMSQCESAFFLSLPKIVNSISVFFLCARSRQFNPYGHV